MLAGREFKSRRVHDYQRCIRTPMSWGESKLTALHRISTSYCIEWVYRKHSRCEITWGVCFAKTGFNR